MQDGGEIYAQLWIITAVKDDGESVTHYVGNFSDIIEDKEAEVSSIVLLTMTL